MPTPQETLQNEAQLLNSWITQAESAGFGEWSEYFRRWGEINLELAELPGNELNTELDNEVARLTKMRNALAGDTSDGAKFWVDMLNLDIASANALKV